MSPVHAHALWDAADRPAAMAAALAAYGAKGERLAEAGTTWPLTASDRARFADPVWVAAAVAAMPAMFAFGVEGYTDDRLADGPGWTTFEVGAIHCPVVVLHGEGDTICPPVNARRTATLVPGAELRLLPDLGHFSIVDEIVPTITGAGWTS